MELITDVVQGPYAFLLILQVLIVSGLTLTLIWLVIQRTRQGAAAEAVVAAPQESTSPEGEAQDGELGEPVLGEPVVDSAATSTETPAESVGETPAPAAASELTPEPAQKAPMASVSESNVRHSSGEAVPSGNVSQVLDEKEKEMKALADESLALKDKIKYLESRLMEYEIVQEEISNLSQLRVENERLKEELLQFQASKPRPASGDGGPQGGGSTPPAASGGSTPTDGAPPQGQAAQGVDPHAVEQVSQAQIDSILSKLDDITAKQ